jgi:ABC-type lipoprotein export system ATPase subunit
METTMVGRFPRGAEWRVWDLQVHTPFSELNNGFGQDYEAYGKIFFTKAIEKNIAVVGVTDYFVVDGYRFLKELQNDEARLTALLGAANVQAAKAITLFANVELRTDILVDGSRVNYHVIFSDEVSADDITDNFLAQLHFTSEGNPQGIDQQESLTRKNLEELGKHLKSHHQSFSGLTDIFVGMMQATVDHKQVSEVLGKRESKFGSKYVFCVPCDEDLSKVSWDGQGHMVRKVLIQKSHMLVTSNRSTRDFALGLKHPTTEDYIKEFRTFKPCIHSSDAHNPAELFEPAESRLTWIKADPTFRGLLQTLNEPDSRVYIGPCPPGIEAVRARPTKVVKELGVHKKLGTTIGEKWFDHQLELNADLIAIIGNKGSGKSALADILGLIGNTPRYEAFSFLSTDRFNDRKNNKAKHFEATAIWGDYKIDGPVSLDDTPPKGAVEKIKYIPQDYLERICNEVSHGSGSKFYEELQNVIFSHVPISEQLGFSSLDDLLRHRSGETKRTIDLLIDQLKGINRALVNCEEQLTDGHKKSLEAQLAAKQRELEAHDATKPTEHAQPPDDPTMAQVASETGIRLQTFQATLADTEEQISASKKKLNQTTQRRASAERLLGKLSNIEKQLSSASKDAQIEITELGLRWEDLVKVEIDKTSVASIIRETTEEIDICNAQLDPTISESYLSKQQGLKQAISAISQELTAPQRAYEAYKAAVKGWEDGRNTIVGTPDQLGSLNQLTAALANLPNIKERELLLKLEQVEKAREIYNEKEKLRDDYGRYYGAVQKFLAEHPLARSQEFKLAFNVAITEQRFAQSFLKALNQRRMGTFAGSEEGAEGLKQLLEGTDFDSVEDATRFLNEIMRALHEDQRQGRHNAAMELRDQLAQGSSVTDLYDFLFSFSYLEPVYNLRWDGKTLEQLSPGERGNLLLIFYLLIDRDDIPLVIDQPEENLDNNTVYRTLVPCVKEAKKRRQIIMVTHNPNLAVVCDAEQIICAEIRKDHGHEVRYLSGSIEEPLINQKIVDILEGTRPAFDKRDAKYFPQG